MNRKLLFSIGSMIMVSQAWGQCTPAITCTPDTSYTIVSAVCDTVFTFNEPTMTGCPTGTLVQISCEGSGSTFPAGPSTAEYVTMDDVYFFEDFTNNSAGWTAGTEWEFGSASASTGSFYNNDPSTDNSCSNDNGIAGVVIGGLNTTTLHAPYYLTSPIIDLSVAPGNVFLDFYRWLNSDYTPYMQNFVEVYDGAAWVQVWASGASPGIQDNSWTLITYDVTAYANPNFQVRFGHTVGGSGAIASSSWNLDDIMLRGDTPTAVGDTCSVVLTINESTVPVPDVATLPDLTGECVTVGSAPTATDACSGAITGTTTDTLSYTTDGSYVINWTYDDSVGNVVTQTQNVIVDDITAPVADLATLPDTSGCTITVVAPTATDNCVGSIVGTTTDPLTYNQDGTYTVTWTFDDGNGNTTTQTQDVIIVNPISVSGITSNEITGGDGSIDVTQAGGAPTVTYSWDNGATTEDLTGLSAGSYTLTVTDGNGCQSVSTYTLISEVGIEENSTYFNTYPNPTSGIVVINLSSINNATTLIVKNYVGQVIKKMNVTDSQFEIDISNYSDGIYFIEITDNDSKTIQKIVKQ